MTSLQIVQLNFLLLVWCDLPGEDSLKKDLLVTDVSTT